MPSPTPCNRFAGCGNRLRRWRSPNPVSPCRWPPSWFWCIATPGINQRDLAEEVGVNPGALVRLLDQAAALGFLERQESAGDRRFKTLRILPAGAELAQKVETAADKLRVELMHDVPLEDIETATRILRLFEERAGHYLQQAGNEP